MCSILVSIIVPSHNQGKYLTQTIESVIAQTYNNWECIIINDGSSDNTENVARYFLQRDSRIKYIYQTNQGICQTRNNAIKQSMGEYVLCLDGDDWISNNFLEEMVEVLSQDKNVKVVTSTVKLFGKRNKILNLPEYSLEALMGRNLFVMTSMFRRKDFDSSGGFNKNMELGLEDWDFWLSILEKGGKVVKTERAIFYYRIKKRSRNKNISSLTYELLRQNIYVNHKELFSSHFFNPKDSFEYKMIADSLEYKVGTFFLKPLRFFYG